ncbi:MULTISPECIES: hypothetical protein [unclassified Streptomyces]|uniref:hypothetical protein n=1 Tax=unclassified Streptomyces TaxID=2593676 RepID=UPI001CD36E6C|nr:hypothetical protein [Streptomyces sp. CoH27]
MGKRLLRSVLVAAFSVGLTAGVLSGFASEKGDVRADTTWPAVAHTNVSAMDTTWPAVAQTKASAMDTTWPALPEDGVRS